MDRAFADWGTNKRTEDFYQRLDLIGIKASISMLKQRSFDDNLKHMMLLDEFIVGIIKLEDSNIEAINIICQWPWGGNGIYSYYSLHFLVRSHGLFNSDRVKKTKMKIKRNSLFGNKLVDVEWKGDINIARKLNSDITLRDKLLNAEARFPGNYIEISPEPESGYTRLATRYFFPSAEQFAVLETIAKNIKS